MVEVCKQWTTWFLLEGLRSYLEYETTLVKEETEFSVTLRVRNLIVQKNCKCRKARAMEERLRIHRQRCLSMKQMQGLWTGGVHAQTQALTAQLSFLKMR
ncbi:hypothetical protein RND81_06G105600 [Saponaria officinalis]|uniref:Uncharacterized protein n=1 Tax=Saponaria officinalis TaxID=3572 RepID=A0AAW1KAB0_SAPOF